MRSIEAPMCAGERAVEQHAQLAWRTATGEGRKSLFTTGVAPSVSTHQIPKHEAAGTPAETAS